MYDVTVYLYTFLTLTYLSSGENCLCLYDHFLYEEFNKSVKFDFK